MAANQIQGASGLVTARAGALNQTLMAALLAEYGEQAVRGWLYSTYSTAVALSLPATATVGAMVWNPPGSGVRIHLLEFSSMNYATDADCTGVVLAVGYQTTTPTSTTAATFYGRTLISQATAVVGQAKCYSIATVLTAPLAVELLQHNTAAIATTGEDLVRGSFKGAWVLEEGGFATTAAHGAAATAWAGHILFAEVPKVL